MKKRLMSLLLLFAMFVSLWPGRASAMEMAAPPADEPNAGGISYVHIWIDPPSVGDKPSYYPRIDPDDKNYSIDTATNDEYFKNGVLWRDITGEHDMLADSETFVSGHVYRVRIYLSPGKGFVFANNVVGIVNGTTYQVETEILDDERLKLNFTFPAVTHTLIKYPNATVVPPSVGDRMRYDLELPEDAHYSANLNISSTGIENGISWRDATADQYINVDSQMVFIKDHVYQVRISLVPDEGYQFSPLVIGSVNGSTAAETRILDEGGIRLMYEFPAAETTLIFNADVLVPVPVIGKMPSYDPELPGDANYHPDTYTSNYEKNGILWRDMTAGKDMEVDSVAFEAGHEYRLRVYLAPDDGYEFSYVFTDWTINGTEAESRYYEDGSGILLLTRYFPALQQLRGWVKEEGFWYYYNEDGTLATGWKKIKSVWYYFAADGEMQTGWQKINNKWYYFASSGAMQTGWQMINNKWYYFASSGEMQTGWKQINNKWYYFASGGSMITGWKQIDGVWYYFKSSGVMAAKEWCEGYYLNANGSWTYPYKASWKKNGKGWWFGDTSGWYAKSCTITIDSKFYTFNAAGYLVE